MEDLGEAVFTFEGSRDTEHMGGLDLEEGTGELGGPDTVDLVDDGEAEIVKGSVGEVTVVQGLEHSEDDVLVLGIESGALNTSNTCTGEEIAETLDPLVEEEFFVHDDGGLVGDGGEGFDGHYGVMGEREITQEEPAVTVDFEAVILILGEGSEVEPITVMGGIDPGTEGVVEGGWADGEPAERELLKSWDMNTETYRGRCMGTRNGKPEATGQVHDILTEGARGGHDDLIIEIRDGTVDGESIE